MPTADNGSPITGYVVVPHLGEEPQAPQTFMSTALTQTVTGLTNGSYYKFTVAAINANGTGLPSALSSNWTWIGVPQAPPSVIAVAGSQSATASWTAPDDNGSPITRYRIWVVEAGNYVPVRSFTVNPDVTTTTVTGLVPGHDYLFRVRASNAYGQGPWTPSNIITVLS
jgi:predicted phage tail protein